MFNGMICRDLLVPSYSRGFPPALSTAKIENHGACSWAGDEMEIALRSAAAAAAAAAARASCKRLIGKHREHSLTNGGSLDVAAR